MKVTCPLVFWTRYALGKLATLTNPSLAFTTLIFSKLLSKAFLLNPHTKVLTASLSCPNQTTLIKVLSHALLNRNKHLFPMFRSVQDQACYGIIVHMYEDVQKVHSLGLGK